MFAPNEAGLRLVLLVRGLVELHVTQLQYAKKEIEDFFLLHF